MKHLSLLFLALSQFACSSPQAPVRGQHRPTIFINGNILTMDGERPTYVDAVAIENGRIAFAGSRSEAESALPGALLRDLDGKTMLPGFIDPHGHFMFALNMVNQVNVAIPPVGPCTKIADVVDALKTYRDEHSVPEGEWIVAWGYDQDGLEEQRHITRADLDPAFPDHKVMLIHVSSHGAVLNSQALAASGIDASTETPEGGIIARVEGSQEPAGLVMETAYLPVLANMPQPAEPEMLDLMDSAQQTYARDGYTHAYEGFTHLKDLHFLMKAADEGRIYLDMTSILAFNEAQEWMGNPDYVFGEYHGGLKLQGIKITQDGSPQGRTAFVKEPYLTGGPNGEQDWRGNATLPEAEFEALVKRAFEAGLQVFVHANGDATIDQLIAAVRKAGVSAADDRRTVAIHSQFQRPDHLPDYVELGITPSYFTLHTFFWGDVHVANMGAERAAFISPVRSAKAAGLVHSNHSDFNVTPLDPFYILWSAMARSSRTGVVIGPQERVDIYTALQGLTTGPAYQLFEEDRKGRIKAGLLADFVILSGDPVEAGVEGVRDLEVLETIKEGVTVYAKQ